MSVLTVLSSQILLLTFLVFQSFCYYIYYFVVK
ncbi:unnamed protein product [Spodoptera exigua]|nr:unnamed protein product [Spodoptera exigua]